MQPRRDLSMTPLTYRSGTLGRVMEISLPNKALEFAPKLVCLGFVDSLSIDIGSATEGWTRQSLSLRLW
jgi:hypothetical protein